MEKKCVTECYSLTKKSWISTEELNAFFIPLLSLELTFLSEKERFQIGATPKPGEVNGPPWTPPQKKEGQTIREPQYDVYTVKWPNDSSDFSKKELVFYFDKLEKTFPFPFWVQEKHSFFMKPKARAIDSGHALSLNHSDIPKKQTKDR